MNTKSDALTTMSGKGDRAWRRWIEQRARRLVVRRSAGLQTGRLRVRDRWGTWETGSGVSPAAELTVHDASFYLDLVLEGSLGAAHAYIEGKWSSDDLTALLRFFAANAEQADAFDSGGARLASAYQAWRHRLRANTRAGSRRNIHAHYDLGNAFFALFLDETMTYSSGIFECADSTLRQASIAKLDRICRKLALRPDDHVLEIGCGWGSFAIHAATHYGCRVTATTISEAQYAEARARVAAAGLDDRVALLRRDYRDLSGRYDKLVSIEMVEAVGHDYLPVYFGKCSALLRDHGQMLLQAITISDQRYEQYRRRSDFIQCYVFPGSCVPSLTALTDAATSGSDLRITHLEDIGPHYARTLRCWCEAFEANAEQVRALGYGEEFIRLWRYYLGYCEAGFAERYLGDVQMLLNKPACRAAPLLAPL